MKRARVGWAVCCAVSILSLCAGAGEPDEGVKAFETGKAYFDKGEFDKAHEYLFKAFEAHPQDANINFYLGRTAFERGDYESAVMAFDRILTVNPNLVRVKLELGRSYHKLGNEGMARKEFEEVLATDPPENVKRNIESYLDMMKREGRRHIFNGLLNVGISYDDNIRVAPMEDDVLVPAIPLVTTVADPRDAIMHSATLVLDYKYKFANSPFAWKTTAVNYDTVYNEGERGAGEAGLDVNYYNLQTGPVLQADRLIMELRPRFTYMEQDFDAYLKSWGLGGSFTVLFNKNFVLNAGFKFENKKVYQNRARDADNVTFHISPIVSWKKHRFTFRATAEDEQAKSSLESYKKWRALFRYDRDLPWKMSAYASYEFQNVYYDGYDSLFLDQRKDNVHEFSLGFVKRFTPRLSAELSHTYTRAYSNIGLYDYKRNVSALSFSWSF